MNLYTVVLYNILGYLDFSSIIIFNFVRIGVVEIDLPPDRKKTKAKKRRNFDGTVMLILLLPLVFVSFKHFDIFTEHPKYGTVDEEFKKGVSGLV